MDTLNNLMKYRNNQNERKLIFNYSLTIANIFLYKKNNEVLKE